MLLTSGPFTAMKFSPLSVASALAVSVLLQPHMELNTDVLDNTDSVKCSNPDGYAAGAMQECLVSMIEQP